MADAAASGAGKSMSLFSVVKADKKKRVETGGEFRFAMDSGDESKVEDLLDKLGLKSRANFLPWKLSGGEKQRVAIARAVINNPQFLFLDEPTGNLDNKNANLVQDLIIQIADEYRVALILSTHDNSFAQRMDNIYKISNRNIIEV